MNLRDQKTSAFQLKRWIAPIILVITIPMVCCSLVFGLPMLNNDWLLQGFANNLYDYPLPPETEVVSKDARVELMGNGNHCDFVANQTLVSELPREEIEAYYQDIRLPAVRGDSQLAQNGYIQVRVDFKSSTSDGQTYFSIWIADVGYPPGFDIRCH